MRRQRRTVFYDAQACHFEEILIFFKKGLAFSGWPRYNI